MGKNKEGRYSKRVLKTIVIIWIIVVAYSLFVSTYLLFIAPEFAADVFKSLLVYVDAPMTGGVIGYFIKSARENTEKIKKAPDSEAMECDNSFDTDCQDSDYTYIGTDEPIEPEQEGEADVAE